EVMKRGGGGECAELGRGHFQQLSHFRRIDLCAAHVPVRCLVLGIDRYGERFDGVHVKIGDLFDVFELLTLRAADFIHPFFIEVIKQVNQGQNQAAYEEERNGAPSNGGIEQRG